MDVTPSRLWNAGLLAKSSFSSQPLKAVSYIMDIVYHHQALDISTRLTHNQQALRRRNLLKWTKVGANGSKLNFPSPLALCTPLSFIFT